MKSTVSIHSLTLIIALVLIRTDYSTAFTSNISKYLNKLNNNSSIVTDNFEYRDNEVATDSHNTLGTGGGKVFKRSIISEDEHSVVRNIESKGWENEEHRKTYILGQKEIKVARNEQNARRNHKSHRTRTHGNNRRRNRRPNDQRKSQRNIKKISKGKKQRKHLRKKPRKSNKRRCKGRSYRCGTNRPVAIPVEKEIQKPVEPEPTEQLPMCPGAENPSTESKGPNAESKGPNSESKVPNAESKVPNAESTGSNTESTGSNVESVNPGPESMGPGSGSASPGTGSMGPTGGSGASLHNHQKPLVSFLHLNVGWEQGVDRNKGHANLWVF